MISFFPVITTQPAHFTVQTLSRTFIAAAILRSTKCLWSLRIMTLCPPISFYRQDRIQWQLPSLIGASQGGILLTGSIASRIGSASVRRLLVRIYMKNGRRNTYQVFWTRSMMRQCTTLGCGLPCPRSSCAKQDVYEDKILGLNAIVRYSDHFSYGELLFLSVCPLSWHWGYSEATYSRQAQKPPWMSPLNHCLLRSSPRPFILLTAICESFSSRQTIQYSVPSNLPSVQYKTPVRE